MGNALVRYRGRLPALKGADLLMAVASWGRACKKRYAMVSVPLFVYGIKAEKPRKISRIQFP